MTHGQKVKRLISELKQKGMSPHEVAPPLWRFLWMLGWNVKPPLFMGLVAWMLIMGITFEVLWGVMMLLAPLRHWVVAKVILVVAGLMFGIMRAEYLRRKAKLLGLPVWSSYPEKPLFMPPEEPPFASPAAPRSPKSPIHPKLVAAQSLP